MKKILGALNMAVAFAVNDEAFALVSLLVWLCVMIHSLSKGLEKTKGESIW